MISIVTPTYNSENYIEKCILSIRNQSFKDYEHIIVDGGSMDGTLAVVKKYEGTYPMRWISEIDNGMYDAISKGFKMARGNIFCWLNSDDIYMPWTLEIVSNVFKSNEIKWITGVPSHIDENGIQYFDTLTKVVYPRFAIRSGWMDGRRLGCIQQESTFWRRELYEKSGGLNSEYRLAGDYFLWKSFAKYESLYSVNSMLAAFRVHGGQKSEDKSKYFHEIGKLSRLGKMARKFKLYKVVNKIAKKRCNYLLIDVRNI